MRRDSPITPVRSSTLKQCGGKRNPRGLLTIPIGVIPRAHQSPWTSPDERALTITSRLSALPAPVRLPCCAASRQHLGSSRATELSSDTVTPLGFGVGGPAPCRARSHLTLRDGDSRLGCLLDQRLRCLVRNEEVHRGLKVADVTFVDRDVDAAQQRDEVIGVFVVVE